MRSQLTASLALSLVPLTALAQGLTGEDVREACQVAPLCKAPSAAVLRLCSLATGQRPARAAWDAVFREARPTPAEVSGTPSCEQKSGLEAVTAPPRAGAAPSPFSGFSQSNLLWGTADFLVGRAEEELRAWAVDRFLRMACEGEEARLGGQPLFPATCRAIQGTHLRGFMNGLGTLRAAMRLDAQRLPALAFAEAATRPGPTAEPAQVDAALAGWQASMALARILGGESTLAALQATATDAPPRAIECRHPAATFLFHASALARTFGASKKLADLEKPAERNLALLALAVNRRGDPAISGRWPCEATAPDGKPLHAAGFDVEGLYDATGYLLEALERARSAAGELERLAGASRPEARIQAFGNLAAAGVGVYRAAAAGARPGGVGEAQLRMLSAAEDVARDLGAGSYSTAVVKLGGALAAVWAQKLWPEEFQRLAAFLADVAEAQTAEEASAAIARAAEPVGGYRRKRAAGFHVGVNGYFGASAVAEWTGGWENRGTALGFWAPVGLEAGFGSRADLSFGLLLQAIDLGVLASWRVGNDDLSTAPQVSVKQVLSPGAFVVLGLPRMPLSLSAGVAFSPKLRTLSAAAGAVERERDAYRIGLAVAVDIPIFY